MVGVSPIIGGAPVRGMADACLAAIGVQTTAAAVAAHYGAGLLDGWLVDEQDKAAADAPELAGITVRALPLYMTDLAATAEIARAAVELAGSSPDDRPRPGGPIATAEPDGHRACPGCPRSRPATTSAR